MGYSTSTTIAGRRFFRRTDAKARTAHTSISKGEIFDALHMSLIIVFGMAFLYLVTVLIPSKVENKGTRSYLRPVYGAISTITAPFSHEKALDFEIKAKPISPVDF